MYVFPNATAQPENLFGPAFAQGFGLGFKGFYDSMQLRQQQAQLAYAQQRDEQDRQLRATVHQDEVKWRSYLQNRDIVDDKRLDQRLNLDERRLEQQGDIAIENQRYRNQSSAMTEQFRNEGLDLRRQEAERQQQEFQFKQQEAFSQQQSKEVAAQILELGGRNLDAALLRSGQSIRNINTPNAALVPFTSHPLYKAAQEEAQDARRHVDDTRIAQDRLFQQRKDLMGPNNFAPVDPAGKAAMAEIDKALPIAKERFEQAQKQAEAARTKVRQIGDHFVRGGQLYIPRTQEMGTDFGSRPIESGRANLGGGSTEENEPAGPGPQKVGTQTTPAVPNQQGISLQAPNMNDMMWNPQAPRHSTGSSLHRTPPPGAFGPTTAPVAPPGVGQVQPAQLPVAGPGPTPATQNVQPIPTAATMPATQPTVPYGRASATTQATALPTRGQEGPAQFQQVSRDRPTSNPASGTLRPAPASYVNQLMDANGDNVQVVEQILRAQQLDPNNIIDGQ